MYHQLKVPVSILVITALIVTMFSYSSTASVYAEDAEATTAVVDLAKVYGDVNITSDGTQITASTSAGIITSGSAEGGVVITGSIDSPYNVTVDGSGGSRNIDITLSDASIKVNTTNEQKSAFRLTNSADVTLTVKGNNSIVGGYSVGSGGAGIEVSSPQAILITGDGVLDAIGGHGNNGGAGIGGGHHQEGSNITISGDVTVNAESRGRTNSGAGIGGGRSAAGKNITITGNAIVNANVSEIDRGTGIGGGFDAEGSDIVISGNSSVCAIGNTGIGGGRHRAGKNILITGNAKVVAIGKVIGAGIGSGGSDGGLTPAGLNIKISGNSTVYAQSMNEGAGIGGSLNGNGIGITISDNAVVTAIGGNNSSGIGGGSWNSEGSNITIEGGFVTAMGQDGSDDIGSNSNKSSTDIKIIKGSVYAVNNAIGTTPTGIDGEYVYRVAVPAGKIPGSDSFIGNLDIEVPLNEGFYQAKTVSDKNEHGDTLPSDVSAYIYLPEGKIGGINIGQHQYGYADVVSSGISETNNIILHDKLPIIIMFDPMDGTIDTKYVFRGVYSYYGTLPAAEKPGYRFKGWYTDKTGGKMITERSKTELLESQTLYARYEKNPAPAVKSYTVNFNAKGGKIIGKKSIIVKYNDKYGTLPKAKRKGYNFKGWYTKDKKRIKNTTIMKYQNNITLYAKWTKNGKVKSSKSVWLMKKNSLKSKKIMRLKKNKKVSIVGKKGKWYKIKVGKKTGFVLKKYIKKVK